MPINITISNKYIATDYGSDGIYESDTANELVLVKENVVYALYTPDSSPWSILLEDDQLDIPPTTPEPSNVNEDFILKVIATTLNPTAVINKVNIK